MAMPETVIEDRQPVVNGSAATATAESRLRAQAEMLEHRLHKRDEQRRAMLHIIGDLTEFNKRHGGPARDHGGNAAARTGAT